MNEVVPIDKEYIFEGSMMISQTDLKGNITYVNRKFCEVSGYKIDELVGSSHNIIRHPDMPKATFSKLWEAIADGQSWNGLIKSLRKDGLFYWVDIEIIPVNNEENKLTGFISTRKVASRKDIEENKKIYQKMLDSEV